jgi:hypothetical protein
VNSNRIRLVGSTILFTYSLDDLQLLGMISASFETTWAITSLTGDFDVFETLIITPQDQVRICSENEYFSDNECWPCQNGYKSKGYF